MYKAAILCCLLMIVLLGLVAIVELGGVSFGDDSPTATGSRPVLYYYFKI